jgi:hypothetical protein
MHCVVIKMKYLEHDYKEEISRTMIIKMIYLEHDYKDQISRT